MKASLRQSQLLTSILRPLLSKLRPARLPVLRRREARGADLSGLACAFVPEGSAWPGQRTFVSKVQELACVPRRGPRALCRDASVRARVADNQRGAAVAKYPSRPRTKRRGK